MYSRIEYRIVLLWVQRMYALHIVPQWSRTLLWICVCGEIIGILCGYGSLSAQSADELLSQQSFVRQIRLDQAWRTLDALPPPAQPMTIAVIAGGFDLTHPDLQGAWFVNPNDPINGRDDDNNGFIDDNQIFTTPWWTAATMDQAAGRVLRIGQKKQVAIHHIALEEEMETSMNIDDYMNERVEMKRQLCDLLLQAADHRI